MAIGGPAAQTPPAVVPVGPRGALAASTTRTNPAFSNATSPTLPGAIAAFASGAATGQVGTKSETVGPRQPAVRVQKSAALGAEPTEVDSNKPVADVAVVKPQQERARSRPVRQAPPVVFKYPTPSYLGFQAPKFANGGFSKPERSSFGPRIYEGFVRNLR